MSFLNSIFIMTTAFLAVFLEDADGVFRYWFGAQADFLPAIVVCAALREGLPCAIATAVAGGLCYDSLSANDLGVTTLPLLAAGAVLSAFRGLLMRDAWHAQFALGAAASAVCPLLSLVILMSLGRTPLLGWPAFWEVLFVALSGGVATPFFFRAFGWLNRVLNYQPATGFGFRADREIKRGRSGRC
jgi:rod shape-determining protein MreD